MRIKIYHYFSIFSFSFSEAWLILIPIFLLALLIIILYSMIKFKYKCNEDSFYLKRQLDAQISHYKLLEENNHNIKCYYHDMINHYNTINILMNSNKIDEAHDYVLGIIGDLYEPKIQVINTNNPALDAILTEKIIKAKNCNIKISTEIMLVDNIKVDAVDWCILFGNILDNAIEACEKIKNDDKHIWLKLVYGNSMLSCRIKNSIDENVIINKDFSSMKKDSQLHGFGLCNIKKTVEKYGGELIKERSSEYFEISFILFDV